MSDTQPIQIAAIMQQLSGNRSLLGAAWQDSIEVDELQPHELAVVDDVKWVFKWRRQLQAFDPPTLVVHDFISNYPCSVCAINPSGVQRAGTFALFQPGAPGRRWRCEEHLKNERCVQLGEFRRQVGGHLNSLQNAIGAVQQAPPRAVPAPPLPPPPPPPPVPPQPESAPTNGTGSPPRNDDDAATDPPDDSGRSHRSAKRRASQALQDMVPKYQYKLPKRQKTDIVFWAGVRRAIIQSQKELLARLAMDLMERNRVTKVRVAEVIKAVMAHDRETFDEMKHKYAHLVETLPAEAAAKAIVSRGTLIMTGRTGRKDDHAVHKLCRTRMSAELMSATWFRANKLPLKLISGSKRSRWFVRTQPLPSNSSSSSSSSATTTTTPTTVDDDGDEDMDPPE